MPQLPDYLQPAISFLVAFIVVNASIPSIIRVARTKQLFDEPGHRTSHKSSTPTLGGMAIFAGFILSVTLCSDSMHMPSLQYVIAATVIVFFVGVKDDILVTAPGVKFIGQLVAACIIVVLGDIRLTDLHGFFGIHELHYLASVGVSLFLILTVTNGFNLIDGIDGLASGVGAVCAATLGVWLYLLGEVQYSVVAFGLVASLLAFFRFNVYSKNNKIFMGDTGSLTIGLVCSVLAIKFNEANLVDGPYSVYSSPAVTFGILIVPLFDTLRIIFVRLVINRSPFKPDKNHIHHRLLELGFSHKKATYTIVFVNLIFIAFVACFHTITIRRQLMVLLLMGMFFSAIPSFLLNRKEKRRERN